MAFGSAVGATLTFCVASFVGFESAAIYSEEVRDPKKTVARATFIAVGLIAVFYALSGWLVGVAAGPSTIVDPGALGAAGFGTPDAPDPTTVLFITGADRLGAFWGDAASLLFATSLFAALLSFHNAVSRYGFALGRERVLPHVFGKVNDRTGAPYVASATQTVLALGVVSIFALSDADPVLKLFTWLTNLGALGVLLLMAMTSFAVVAYFRREAASRRQRLGVALRAGHRRRRTRRRARPGRAQLQRPDHERDRRPDRQDDHHPAGDPVRRRAARPAGRRDAQVAQADVYARIGEGPEAEVPVA